MMSNEMTTDVLNMIYVEKRYLGFALSFLSKFLKGNNRLTQVTEVKKLLDTYNLYE